MSAYSDNHLEMTIQIEAGAVVILPTVIDMVTEANQVVSVAEWAIDMVTALAGSVAIVNTAAATTGPEVGVASELHSVHMAIIFKIDQVSETYEAHTRQVVVSQRLRSQRTGEIGRQ